MKIGRKYHVDKRNIGTLVEIDDRTLGFAIDNNTTYLEVDGICYFDRDDEIRYKEVEQ